MSDDEPDKKGASTPPESGAGAASEPPEEDFPDEGDLPDSLPPEADLAETGIVVDDVDLKDALRGALRPPPGAVAPNLLRGVQRKLRLRSRGKFYGDGWSNSASPRSTYLITSFVMLALVLIVFFALLPWSSSKLP